MKIQREARMGDTNKITGWASAWRKEPGAGDISQSTSVSKRYLLKDEWNLQVDKKGREYSREKEEWERQRQGEGNE